MRSLASPPKHVEGVIVAKPVAYVLADIVMARAVWVR